METKICKKRNHTYDASLPRCPECRKINTLAWHENNKEYKKEKDRLRAEKYRLAEKTNEVKLCRKRLHLYPISDAYCKFCKAITKKTTAQIWYQKNRERELARGREYRKRCKATYEAAVKRYNEQHPGFQRGCMLRAKFWPHLTWQEALAEYDRMHKEQNGVCYICQKPETAVDRRTRKVRYLAVDHCHTTKQVRSLLCYACNSSLGIMKEDSIKLQRLLEYVIKWNEVK